MRFSRPEIPRPDKKVTERVTDSILWQYRLFLLAGLAAIAGGTLAVGGIVLLLIFALEGAVLGVIAASFMFATGGVLALGVYLWLTTPMG